MGGTFREHGWGDREVKVSKTDLLEKLVKNRTQHIKDYNEACAGYREAALKRIDEMTAEVKESIGRLKEGETIAIVDLRFGLPVPISHEAAYDQIIKMMEMSIDDKVTLTASQFSCFVMDDWEWKEQWVHLNSLYGAAKR